MFSLVVSALAASVPVEYVVDCSGWAGNGTAKVTFEYTCWNGDRIATSATCGPRSSGALAVIAFTDAPKFEGWQFSKLGQAGHETAFVIRGSKTSPIRSVTFKGDVWVPVVTRRLAVPPTRSDTAPAPREVKP